MNILTTLGVFLLCILHVRTLELNSWQSLQEKLHEKVREIFQGEKQIKISSGKYFKYFLEDLLGGEKFVGKYEVFDQSTKKLPNWLLYNSVKNKLHGVPTDNELKQTITLEIRRTDENAKTGFSDGSTFIQLGKTSENPFNCQLEDTTVASIIFHTDISNFKADYRIKFLRNFAQVMELSTNDVYLYEGNRMETDFSAMNLRKAGPGDKVDGKQPGITVSWKVTCGRDIVGNPQLAKLAELSEREDFKSTFLEPVLGWFVMTINGRSRRALGVGGTPVLSSSISVGGTPILGPSPSVTIVSTEMVKPTPTKSSPVMRMTSATFVPPTTTSTSQPTTTEHTTTTIQSTTTRGTTKTEKPTTKSTDTPLITTVPANKPPVLKNRLNTVTVIAGQALQKELPVDMFEDADGDSLTITFEYYPEGIDNPKKIVPADHWVAYKNRNLYMLPPKDYIRKDKIFEEGYYTLTATDPHGAYVIDAFKLQVKGDPDVYNNLYNLTLDLDFNQFNKDVEKRVKLIKSLANGMRRENEMNYKFDSDFDYIHLRSLSFIEGSVIVRWGVSGNNQDLRGCNSVHAESYLRYLQSAKFKEYLYSKENLLVINASMTTVAECTILPDTVGSSDSGLWQRIFIPVIIVVVILIIIALILCCIYRRKRKNEPVNEAGANDYFRKQNGKKPTIFLEEYEEKPEFVNLQPLILPNEKPPVQQAYEPRADTPDDSPLDSDFSGIEEKGLILGSPKESQRKGFMNAPPPYSANI